jgi:transaldolase
MRDVIEAVDADTEIIAASVKSPAEAVETLLAGAHHLTLPLGVIEEMAGHELSDRAIDEFGRAQ